MSAYHLQFASVVSSCCCCWIRHSRSELSSAKASRGKSSTSLCLPVPEDGYEQNNHRQSQTHHPLLVFLSYPTLFSLQRLSSVHAIFALSYRAALSCCIWRSCCVSNVIASVATASVEGGIDANREIVSSSNQCPQSSRWFKEGSACRHNLLHYISFCSSIFALHFKCKNFQFGSTSNFIVICIYPNMPI